MLTWDWSAGTAHDLTFLIDHIPAYIYPQVERNIVEWGVAGISLGGHSTWIALARGTSPEPDSLSSSCSLTPISRL